MKKLKIYFAAPLFKQSERIWNRILKKEIEKRAKIYNLKIEILFPQDIAEKILSNKTYSEEQKLMCLYKALRDYLVISDIVISILDGADVESGTSAETFGGRIMNKKIIGVRTDFRNSGEEKGLNLMLSKALDKFIYFPAFNENYKELAEKIVKAIKDFQKD